MRVNDYGIREEGLFVFIATKSPSFKVLRPIYENFAMATLANCFDRHAIDGSRSRAKTLCVLRRDSPLITQTLLTYAPQIARQNAKISSF
jgi:hypothetical protein